MLKTINVNSDVNYCQFKVDFCFGWMSDASLATKNKNKRNNFYTTKIIEYYTKLTKIIIDGKQFEIHDKKRC